MSNLIKNINNTLTVRKLKTSAENGNPFALAEIEALNSLSEPKSKMTEGKCGGSSHGRSTAAEDEEINNDPLARIADNFKGMDMIDTLPDEELADAIGDELENVAGLEGKDQSAMITKIIKMVRGK